MCDPSRLAVIAREEAEKPYNGKWNNRVPNIQDIVALFPKWSVDEQEDCRGGSRQLEAGMVQSDQ